MSAPRHRVRRQIIEVVVTDRDSSWPLQSELSRIQIQSIEEIIDRCCTELGDPERLHRIDSLEVDLGKLNAQNLEQELVRTLAPKLHEALAVRLRAEDAATSLQGKDPQTSSWLELLAYFARTGNLPWWADATKPRLIEQTVWSLLKRAAPALIGLMQQLAGDRRALRRIVLHCAQEPLTALFGALLTASPQDLSARTSELLALLRRLEAHVGRTPEDLRTALWLNALRAACIKDNRERGAPDFWRDVLAHSALELGRTYSAILSELDAQEAGVPVEPTDPAGRILRRLVRELKGEQEIDTEASVAAASPHLAEAAELLRQALAVARAEPIDAPADRGEELAELLAELVRARLPLQTIATELRAQIPNLSTHARRRLLDATKELAGHVAAQGPSSPEAASVFLRWLGEVLAARWLPSAARLGSLTELEKDATSSLHAHAVQQARAMLLQAQSSDDGAALFAVLAELERSRLPLRSLFAELRARISELPARSHGPLLDTLKELAQHVVSHGADSAETTNRWLHWLRTALASRWIPESALLRGLAELEQTAERLSLQVRTRNAKPELTHPDVPSIDLTFSDSDEAYIDNAGLVILWPFIGHLFSHLELVSDKRFKDRGAMQRAVGLLQYLVTEDPMPPEYQLLLPKILCGMKRSEVFEFGPPVTEAEAAECTNLLTAAIESAPILKQQSIAAFRGSFLLRKGVLSARDGAWLLRVERVAYDVVLDRFPWPISWLKLPWMEVPLCVEW